MQRDDTTLSARLQHLATATLVIGFAGAVGATRLLPPSTRGEPFHDTRRLLEEVRREAGTARTIAECFCAIPAVPAVAFLFLGYGGTYNGGGEGSLTIKLTGNSGVQQFTFASGTSVANIIMALNTFTASVGVHARMDPATGERLELSSTEVNADGFVRVRILRGPAILFAENVGGDPLSDHKDYGANAITLSATVPSVP